MTLEPQEYSELSWQERKRLREQYIKAQDNKCFYCKENIHKDPPKRITKKSIDWDLFPEGFLKYPIHLQHDHDTDMTKGAVHAYCNALMWQYEGE